MSSSQGQIEVCAISFSFLRIILLALGMLLLALGMLKVQKTPDTFLKCQKYQQVTAGALRTAGWRVHHITDTLGMTVQLMIVKGTLRDFSSHNHVVMLVGYSTNMVGYSTNITAACHVEQCG